MVRRIVVVVGGVDSVENSFFAVSISKNAIRKSVEELSTYPHCRWITSKCAEIMGTERRVLRRASTGCRIAPISPTRCTRIIHNVGDLSTENGRLSPEKCGKSCSTVAAPSGQMKAYVLCFC